MTANINHTYIHTFVCAKFKRPQGNKTNIIFLRTCQAHTFLCLSLSLTLYLFLTPFTRPYEKCKCAYLNEICQTNELCYVKEWDDVMFVGWLIFAFALIMLLQLASRKEKLNQKYCGVKRACVCVRVLVFSFYFIGLVFRFWLSTCKIMVRRIIKCYIQKLIWIEMSGCGYIECYLWFVCHCRCATIIMIRRWSSRQTNRSLSFTLCSLLCGLFTTRRK